MGIVSSVLSLLMYAKLQNADINPIVTNKCNCVYFARAIRDDLPRGLTSKRAKAKIAQDKEADIGDVVLTSEGWYGHAAIVTNETDDEITIVEANYRRCSLTIRTIKKDSKYILGYY